MKVASAVKVLAALNVLVPPNTLLVVVPNAVEMVRLPVLADVCRGYVAASERTPVLVMTPVVGTYVMPAPALKLVDDILFWNVA